jgi:hypothetical protein
VVDRRDSGGGGGGGGRGELPEVPSTAETWGVPSTVGAPARYAAHYRLKGDELPEEAGLRPTMPWYFRHTSRHAAFPHAQTMMRVRCSLTHLAGCVGRHTAPAAPRACRRCTSGNAQTVEHVLLDCPASAPLRAEPRFTPLFQPPLPGDGTFMMRPQHYSLARYCHEFISTEPAPGSQ